MRVLFLCTHNRCRSILAEAITNQYASRWLTARSAGSHPSGEVHPSTLRYLAELGVPVSDLRSESWHGHENWRPEIVITVCDAAAGEACPVWLGKAARGHWGLPDPSRIEGGEPLVRAGFEAVIDTLRGRVSYLANALDSGVSREELVQVLAEAGDRARW